MSKHIHLFSVIIIILSYACQTEAPSEEEVKGKIIGEYCSFGEKDYRLILNDSTYYSIRYSPGVLTQTPIRDSCNGLYELVFKVKHWKIKFAPDQEPDATIENCKAEYLLWDRKQGYVIGEEKITLNELFDGVAVTRAACEP